MRTRRQLAPALFVIGSLVVIGSAPAVNATALPRLAASLDLKSLAASVVSGSAASALLDEMALAIPTRTVLPESIELLGATTEVRIGLPHEGDMNIAVSDESGALVCAARVHMPAGWQKVAFSGRGSDGKPLPNGVYFYRVTVDDDVMVTRVVINR